MQYKEKWVPFSLNDNFWREVLEGRTIREVKFSEDGIKSLLLDSGEEVFVDKESVYIITEIDAQVA